MSVRSNNVWFVLLALGGLAACSDPHPGAVGPGPGGHGTTTGDGGTPAGGGGTPGGGSPDGGSPSDDANVMRVTVNGDLCVSSQYTNINEPCTSVTICQPGTSACQTIDGILVDTGSTGLRLFASVVHLPLAPVPSGGGTLAECESFSGGMSSWGSIAYADVVLGHEPAVKAPVFLIDPKFAAPTGPCDPTQSQLDTTPQGSGFNGILGISHHPEDCGDECRTNAKNNTYYQCTATGCTSTTTAVQLVNPVGLLPVDGNGEILALPAVPATGAPSVTGQLILGIGTRANNMPGAVSVFPTGSFATLFTDFRATPIASGTIDSGSSKYYLPRVSRLPVCSSSVTPGNPDPTGPLCPTTSQSVTATMESGAIQKAITFTIDDADTLRASSNSVFPGYAAAVSVNDPYFMWGLPFFLGRSVYVAIDGKPSILGVGPYWAY